MMWIGLLGQAWACAADANRVAANSTAKADFAKWIIAVPLRHGALD
jgi:hypothetical protein